VTDVKQAAPQAADQSANTAAQPTVEELWNLEAKRRADPTFVEEPAKTPAPASTTAEPAPVEPATGEEIPDELKAMLEKFDTLTDVVRKLEHQVRSSEGRVGAMQREFQEAKRAAQTVAAPAPNPMAINAAQKTPEKWEQLKKDFPEWGEAVEELVAARAQPVPQPTVDLKPILDEIHTLRSQTSRAIEEAKVFGAHRDWIKVINSDDFLAWHKLQTPEVQALAASDKGEDAIEMLDKYKVHAQQVKDKSRNTTAERAARLAAAAQPVRKGAVPPPKADSELTDAEIWAQEAEARTRVRANRP
jgi:hypothetical protein